MSRIPSRCEASSPYFLSVSALALKLKGQRTQRRGLHEFSATPVLRPEGAAPNNLELVQAQNHNIIFKSYYSILDTFRKTGGTRKMPSDGAKEHRLEAYATSFFRTVARSLGTIP